MSRPKSKYKQFEVVSPYMLWAAEKLNKKGNKKVILHITNSPNKTWELVARDYVKIPKEVEHNAYYLRSKKAKEVYFAKIEAGLKKAYEDGVRVIRVRAIPDTIVKGPVNMKELRPVDDKRIVSLVSKIVKEEAA